MSSNRGQKQFIVLAVIGAIVIVTLTMFIYRQDLRDAYSKWQQGPLPEPVSAAQARRKPALVAKDKTIDVISSGNPMAEQRPTAAPAPSPTPAAAAPVQPPAAEPAAPTPLPQSFNLKVPMIYQAPLSNWDAVHEDACEEASMLMVQAFDRGEESISREVMDRRILDVVDYENRTLGYFQSTDAATTAGIMTDHLKMAGVKVLPVASIDDIKRQVADGRPVMLPCSGRDLHNPNFRNGGPVYHMLVVKGWTAKGIITNDPGTRKGADYVYEPQLLFDAIHDWNGGDVANGAKVMIVAD